MTLRQKNIEIYWAWKSMKQRTQNPKCSAYKNYGARGIRVCKEWQIFEPFCKWALSAGEARLRRAMEWQGKAWKSNGYGCKV